MRRRRRRRRQPPSRLPGGPSPSPSSESMAGEGSPQLPSGRHLPRSRLSLGRPAAVSAAGVEGLAGRPAPTSAAVTSPVLSSFIKMAKGVSQPAVGRGWPPWGRAGAAGRVSLPTPAPHPTRPTPQNLLVKVLALVPQPRGTRVGALTSPGGEQEPAGAAFIPTCVSGEGWGRGPPRAGHPPVSAVVLGVLGCCVGLFSGFFSFFFLYFLHVFMSADRPHAMCVCVRLCFLCLGVSGDDMKSKG